MKQERQLSPGRSSLSRWECFEVALLVGGGTVLSVYGACCMVERHPVLAAAAVVVVLATEAVRRALWRL